MRSQNPLTKFRPKIRFSRRICTCPGEPVEIPCFMGACTCKEHTRMWDAAFRDVMLASLYRDSILANLPIPEVIKTPIIWICGRPWWIWCDRIDDVVPVRMVWVEDQLT